jgi:hypothetical protein
MDPTGKPSEYFLQHPEHYALALAGAGGVAVYAARQGRGESSAPRRLGFLLLACLCAGECTFVFAGTELARRRAARHQTISQGLTP